jgi:hypothetical protein
MAVGVFEAKFESSKMLHILLSIMACGKLTSFKSQKINSCEQPTIIIMYV